MEISALSDFCACMLHPVTPTNSAHSGFQHSFLPPPHDFQDSHTPSSTLELGHQQLPTLNIVYSKVLPLVLLHPCHHVLTLHVYFAFIVFLPTSCLSLTLHPSHLHFPQLMLCPLTHI